MINDATFRALADRRKDKSVSIFIPTHRAGQTEKDQIRFKNGLKEARNLLEEHYGMEKSEAEAHLKQGHDLLEQVEFWRHLSDGLAVFISEDHFHTEILPIPFSEFVGVSDRYYLRPMIPFLTGEDRFFVLALSQKEVKLFEGSRSTMQEIHIADLVPEDMEAALMYDDPENQIQHHSGRGGNETAIFHGQGEGKDYFKEQLKEYFDRIDTGLQEIFHDLKAPLLLACVEFEFPIYKEANSYQHLVDDQHIQGNVLEEDMGLIHEKAWSILQPHFQQQHDRDKELFDANLAAGEASFSVQDIVPAAIGGRVEVLFVDKDLHIWGTYDEATHTIALDDDAKLDLIEEAALRTFLAGGRVYNTNRTDMPRPTGGLNAIYRYAAQ